MKKEGEEVWETRSVAETKVNGDRTRRDNTNAPRRGDLGRKLLRAVVGGG